MSKPVTKFRRLGSMAPKGTGRDKVSITSRGVNTKQNGKLGIAKKAVKANAVKGKSVTTRSSKMQAAKKRDNQSAYEVVKPKLTKAGQGKMFTGRNKVTTPVNMTNHHNSPLSAKKSSNGTLGGKKAVLAKRGNITTHVPSPLNAMKGKPNKAASATKPKNPYGYNGNYSPLS